MTDPVSWLQIAPGWRVVGSDGEPVGSVLSVSGDKSHDIFDGLAISLGESSPPLYVPAESVAAIEPSTVTLRLSGDEAARLEPFREPPPVTVWRPSRPPLRTRLYNWLRGRR